MSDRPFVSVVNVTWNGRRLLEKHLPSLGNLRYPNYEVIIVDNGSTDGSVEFVKRNYPEFKIIQNERNLGTAEGSNVAIKEAKGKYIFWVSNDMEFDPDILDHLVSRCESDETIGICTVKMLRIKNEEFTREIDSVGADIDIFGFPISRGINETDNGQYDYFTDIFFSFGGAMFIKKKVLDIVGSYDPDYLTLADDIDLSWRVHLAGFRVVVDPKSFLYHRVSATLCTTHNRAQKRYLSERNTLRTLLKNSSIGYLFFVLPTYLIILFLEIFFYITIGKFEIVKSVTNALAWNLSNFKDTMDKRHFVQSFRVVNDSVIIKKMSKKPEKIWYFFDFIANRKANRWARYF